MQRQQDRSGIDAGGFDGSSFQQHIERRLGTAIAIPATEAVIANAAHPRRQHCHHCALTIQQWREVAQHQRRADGIDVKTARQSLRIEFGQPLLRTQALPVQAAGCVQDEMKRSLRRQCVRGVFQRLRLIEIQRWLRTTMQADGRRAVLNSMLCILIDPARLGSLASFGEESLAFIDWLRHSPPAPGSEGVVLPGEPERAAREQRSREGIRIDDATWQEIVESGRKVGAKT